MGQGKGEGTGKRCSGKEWSCLSILEKKTYSEDKISKSSSKGSAITE